MSDSPGSRFLHKNLAGSCKIQIITLPWLSTTDGEQASEQVTAAAFSPSVMQLSFLDDAVAFG